MKKQKELSDLIKTVKPKTPSDEEKIIEYCSTLGQKVQFLNNSDNCMSLTYEEFVFWVENGPPAIGDILVYENLQTLGIVSCISENGIHLGVSILGIGGFLISEIIRPKIDFRYATDGEIIKIHQTLSRKGFIWNIWHHGLTKKNFFIPRRGTVVKFKSYINDECGYGGFKEINQDGEIVMYCIAYINGKVRYSPHEILGSAEKYQLAAGNRGDTAKLKFALKECGMDWSILYKRLEPLIFNIDYGETYYYIDETGEILKAKKNHSVVYRKRLTYGNHFLWIEEAEEAKANFMEFRKAQLAQLDVSDTLNT